MRFFYARSNSSGSLVNGHYYNTTTLSSYHYTFYEGNATISNSSACYLVLPQYHPVVLQNGTWINATSCYDPHYGIRQRGTLGIVYACLFATSILFTLGNLRRHGPLFLPQEKRFRAVGRRWQWYWMLFVAACGIIGNISAVDIDRAYLQSLAIILQNFFFYLMIPGLLGVVWEGVRHWGSWQERQVYDRDPFSIPQNDRRGRKEFYMPLIFYLFTWLNFFMNIPRNWDGFDAQGSVQQIQHIAIPSATDIRFKFGAFLAFFAWCIICWALQHAVHYYKPKNRGLLNSLIGFTKYAPTRFMLTIPLLLVTIGYATIASFVWDVNPGNQAVGAGWLYGIGYTPAILIIFINVVAGYLHPNEDRELIRQRIERGQAIDAEIGHSSVRRPWWWRKAGDRFLTTEQRLKALTTEIGGGPATARNIGMNVELGDMPTRQEEDEVPFRDHDPSSRMYSIGDSDSDSGQSSSQRTTSTTTGQRQQVKSMLDV